MLLSAKDAAQLLGLKMSGLYNLVYKRAIPYYKIPNGKNLFFIKEELENLIIGNRFSSKKELASQAATYIVESGRRNNV